MHITIYWVFTSFMTTGSKGGKFQYKRCVISHPSCFLCDIYAIAKFRSWHILVFYCPVRCTTVLTKHHSVSNLIFHLWRSTVWFRSKENSKINFFRNIFSNSNVTSHYKVMKLINPKPVLLIDVLQMTVTINDSGLYGSGRKIYVR